MKRIGYYIAKIKCKLMARHEPIIIFFRRHGIKIGENCLICSYILTKEPFLIEIGDNVTISTNVTFITHDNSIKLILPDKSDLFGKIVIGNNCFIGQNSTILYGVTICDNVIIAAGSVVTKSINQSNVVVGGNPAKIISTWENIKVKSSSKAILRSELINLLEKDNSFLVQR